MRNFVGVREKVSGVKNALISCLFYGVSTANYFIFKRENFFSYALKLTRTTPNLSRQFNNQTSPCTDNIRRFGHATHLNLAFDNNLTSFIILDYTNFNTRVFAFNFNMLRILSNVRGKPGGSRKIHRTR